MAADVSLRLIGTSDLHANVFPYDYYRDRPDDTVGLARTASLIAKARAEVKNSLLLDNGDILQGPPLGDWAARAFAWEPLLPHPMIAAMNALDYAAGSLGNHEFNYGLEALEAAVNIANFPILSCNILRLDGSFYFQPWTLLPRDMIDGAGVPRKLNVGVIGFTTPQIVQWDHSLLAGRLTTMGIAEAAELYVPRLRALGADIVVALCHSGISHVAPTPCEENAALALSKIPGIDAMLLGHQHLRLPGPDFAGIGGVDIERGTLNDIPAFMPGFWGSHIGVIDLNLRQTNSTWRVVDFSTELRPIYERTGETVTPSVGSVESVLEAARAAHEATLAYVRGPVGEIASPINSYFALVADDPSLQIVNSAQLWYARKLIASAPELASFPLLSASAPFKCGGRGGPDYYTDVPAGPVAIKNVADLYVYPNGLRIVKVSGTILREWLERSASLFNRIDPASSEPQPLVDESFASYNFDVIDGIAYTIDVTKPARYDNEGRLVHADQRRIVDLLWQGSAVVDTQTFLVVTNSYRAGGGGHFPGLDAAAVVMQAPDTNRDALIRFIMETHRVAPNPDGTWRFKPWPDSAIVTFQSSPAAASARPPSNVEIAPIGPAPGGFTLYRLRPKV